MACALPLAGLGNDALLIHVNSLDGAPLRLISDAFFLGARENVDEFHW